MNGTARDLELVNAIDKDAFRRTIPPALTKPSLCDLRCGEPVSASAGIVEGVDRIGSQTGSTRHSGDSNADHYCNPSCFKSLKIYSRPALYG